MNTTLRLVLLRVFGVGTVLAFMSYVGVADETNVREGKTCCDECEPCKDSAGQCVACCSATKMKIGAVAYAPSAVTIFEGIRRYFVKHEFPIDYVLYSNYDALVAALQRGEVDVAWNTPLAHAQYHVAAGGESQALVMRDVDCGFYSVLVARRDANIRSLDDLNSQTLVLGSRDAAEATVLPLHFLAAQGTNVDSLKLLELDQRVDLKGNPCCSERHVLTALTAGEGEVGIIGRYLWERIEADGGTEAEQLVEVWRSPEFSHCAFTAAADFDAKRAARFTELMLAMDAEDPQTAEIMRLEGTRRWVTGSQDGFQDLFQALAEGE